MIAGKSSADAGSAHTSACASSTPTRSPPPSPTATANASNMPWPTGRGDGDRVCGHERPMSQRWRPRTTRVDRPVGAPAARRFVPWLPWRSPTPSSTSSATRRWSACAGSPTASPARWWPRSRSPTRAAASRTGRPSHMIDAAEASGQLQPGGTIVEPTSGNTGVGLAIVAAQRGYQCVFVMTDKVSPEKVSLLEAYGAEVVVCPVAVEPDDPSSYYSTAERLVHEIPGAYRPNQYDNPANPESHYDTTGPEIWRQTDGLLTHFVAGVGTGGTITGVARYLKEQNPAVQIVAADPEGSVYSGGSGRPYLVEGIGEDFWPSTYDRSTGRSHHRGDRQRQLPDRSTGHARGGAAHRRVVRDRRCTRPSKWPASPGPTTWSSCSYPTRDGATCPRCTTTAGWPASASWSTTDPPSATCSKPNATDVPTLIYVQPRQHGARRHHHHAQPGGQSAARGQGRDAHRRRRGDGRGRPSCGSWSSPSRTMRCSTRRWRR